MIVKKCICCGKEFNRFQDNVPHLVITVSRDTNCDGNITTKHFDLCPWCEQNVVMCIRNHPYELMGMDQHEDRYE